LSKFQEGCFNELSNTIAFIGQNGAKGFRHNVVRQEKPWTYHVTTQCFHIRLIN
jgi:hypothetical protein